MPIFEYTCSDCGKTFDDLIRCTQGLEILWCLESDADSGCRREEVDRDKHKDCGDGAGDEEDYDKPFYDFAESLHRRHLSYRAAYRGEYKGDDDHKHSVDEEISQRLEDQGILAHKRT